MLKVLKPGFYTSVQDRGRYGFASTGVPISGTMDSYSADLANGILNNSLNDALLEITFGKCELEFLQPTSICIAGGDFSPTLNGKLIQLNKRIYVHKGSVLTFNKINYGVRCYLAVKNGFKTEKVLGSRSYYQNITQEFIIRKNTILPYISCKDEKESTKSSIKIDKNHFTSNSIECYKGPEYDLLNQSQKQKLLTQIFTISNHNNRMGYKLNEAITNDLPQVLTSAVLPGSVQLTPSGKIIILMKDCQVTGGYPRILQVLESSICKMAQKTTQHSLKFSVIGI